MVTTHLEAEVKYGHNRYVILRCSMCLPTMRVTCGHAASWLTMNCNDVIAYCCNSKGGSPASEAASCSALRFCSPCALLVLSGGFQAR